MLPDAQTKLASPRWRAFAELCGEIAGLPRHISQHPGGMVISSRPLIELVPVQPCAMEGRQMCQWDKDSCADAGFLKIDLLGLGMLSAVEECVELIARTAASRSTSRASRSTTPRCTRRSRRPTRSAASRSRAARRCRRSCARGRRTSTTSRSRSRSCAPARSRGRRCTRTSSAARSCARTRASSRPPTIRCSGAAARDARRRRLPGPGARRRDRARRLHVGEAEGLRRAMSRKRSHAALEAYRARFVEGALANGVDERDCAHGLRQARRVLGLRLPEVALGGVRRCSRTSRRGCGTTTAPSSSRAPERAADGLLSAGDARARRAAARRRDACRRTSTAARRSARSRTAPFASGSSTSRGVGEDDARRSSRRSRTSSIRDLAQRDAARRSDELEALVESGACDCFGLKRRELLWQLGLVPRPQTVPGSGGEEKQLALPLDPTVADARRCPSRRVWERMLADYRTTTLSVGVHPLELLRPHLPRGRLSSVELLERAARPTVRSPGMVVARQRPSTANGVVFMLLEDEHAQINLIVPPQVYDRFRALVRGEPLLLARGRYEHVDRNRNVLVRRARVARPARARAHRRRGRARLAAVRAPLRPSLTCPRWTCGPRIGRPRSDRASPRSATARTSRTRGRARRWLAPDPGPRRCRASSIEAVESRSGRAGG